VSADQPYETYKHQGANELFPDHKYDKGIEAAMHGNVALSDIYMI
jgi:hypothetical protein